MARMAPVVVTSLSTSRSGLSKRQERHERGVVARRPYVASFRRAATITPGSNRAAGRLGRTRHAQS
jgi:hypothetical protein